MSTYEANRYAFPATAITAGTFDNARLSSGSVTQHVDLTALSASNLTSGTIPNARYGTPTFSAANLTSVPASAVSTGSWTPGISAGSISSISGQYQKIGQLVHLQWEWKWDSAPSGSDVWYITGAPFTSISINAGSGGNWLVGLGNHSGVDGGTVHQGYIFMRDNSTTIRIMRAGYTAQRTANYNTTSSPALPNNKAADLAAYSGWNYWSFSYVSAS